VVFNDSDAVAGYSRPPLANKHPDRKRSDNHHGERNAGKPGFRIADGAGRAEGRRSGRLRNTDLKVGRASAVLISCWNELVRGVLVVIGLLIVVLRWDFQLMQRAWSKTTGARFHPKREPPSLRFEQDERQSSWSATRFGSRAGTHLHGHWFVTNTSNRNLRLLKARVHKHGADFTNVFTQHPDRNVFGRSGRIVARTGLRMMPTFPRSPLTFRKASFPRYG
jgi:hypothetical protein